MNSFLIKTDNISKIYTDQVGYKIHLLENVSLNLEKNEVVTILAPKGSGKTSLLKIIANLDEPTSGTVEISGKIIYIPSEPASFPWLNVKQNIKFHSNMSDLEIKEIIALIGLVGYEDHYPHNKSEGFRFRISLGRALAHSPNLIVIDEPFNNLNSVTRKEIYSLVRKVFLEKSIPILLGTTNISEAILLSDKIYLMKKSPGEIIGELKIDLPVERDNKLLESSEFISYRSQIEKLVNQKIDDHFYSFSI